MVRKKYERPTKEELDKIESAEKRRRSLELSDLKEVLSTAGGRRFIYRVIEFCKVFQSIWDPSSRIHYLEGQRNVGLMLMRDLEDMEIGTTLRLQLENRKAETNE